MRSANKDCFMISANKSESVRFPKIIPTPPSTQHKSGFPMPRLTTEINLGHILTTFTIMVSGGALYGVQSTQLQEHREWIRRHEALLKEHDTRLSYHDTTSASVKEVVNKFEEHFRRLESAQQSTATDIRELLKHAKKD